MNISKNIIKYEDNKFTLPYVKKEYIENMGGVDKFDQFSNYYNFDHKSKYFRWYMKIFFHFIEISINNSYILYKKVINSKITNLKFRKQLSKELISDYLTIKKDKSKREKYFKDCKLVKINERKRCVFHNYRNDKKTSFICETCGINLSLILCYDLHRNNRYKINNLIK